MNAVQERFCKEYGLSRGEFSQLRQRVEKAVRYQTHEHNKAENHKEWEKLAQDATDNATAYARGFGITLRWDDGFYPSCLKGEYDQIIPLDD